ncbi:MAG: hypothetical protein OSA11_02300 [Candidatus Nanopelagicales bacterium]|nr:hypothetical protein [Candidatus Nanopelagicales bacterium]
MSITTVGIIWALVIIMSNYKGVDSRNSHFLVASAVTATITFTSARAPLGAHQPILHHSDEGSASTVNLRTVGESVALTI